MATVVIKTTKSKPSVSRAKIRAAVRSAFGNSAETAAVGAPSVVRVVKKESASKTLLAQ